jgi:hypothetical protein
MRSADTAMLYWIRQKSAKTSDVPQLELFQLLEKKGNPIGLSQRSFVDTENG